MTNDNDLADDFEAMESNVSRVFIIILGIALFFFFLVLVPYFSLRYDSKDISSEQSVLSNLSKIISSLDKTINESKVIESEYSSIVAESKKALIRTSDYSKQIQKIISLQRNVNITSDSPAMQDILSDIELSPNCINITFTTANWTRCNNDAKLNDETRNIQSLARDAVSQMQVSANKTNKLVTDMINAINYTSYRAKIYKDALSHEVSLGTPTLFVDIGSIFNNTAVLLNDYRARFEPLLGNDTTVFNLVCPTPYCKPIGIADPKDFTDTTTLSEIRNDLEGIRDDLVEKETGINDRIQKVSTMFENFLTPVGTIPIGFQELLALFPFIISILFLFFTYSLIPMMEIRGQVQDQRTYSSLNKSSIARLLFDPTNNQGKKGQKVQIVLLLIPVIIFGSSFVINLLIYFYYDEPSLASDDPFRAAVGLNKLIYLTISVFGTILMSLSLWKLFHYSKEKPPHQKKPDTTSGESRKN